MIATRYAKILMTFGLAFFSLVVAYDNLIDYGSNFAFVQHVLSMDTTFPGNVLMDRAITTPALHHVGYWLIITAEALTGLGFLACSYQLLRQLRSPADRFQRAKTIGVIAATIGFANWFIGFMVAGGEWFAMWQSPIWNGQESAFRFYITMLLVLIFLLQKDEELAPR